MRLGSIVVDLHVDRDSGSATHLRCDAYDSLILRSLLKVKVPTQVAKDLVSIGGRFWWRDLDGAPSNG
jgi:hypothetical protein